MPAKAFSGALALRNCQQLVVRPQPSRSYQQLRVLPLVQQPSRRPCSPPRSTNNAADWHQPDDTPSSSSSEDFGSTPLPAASPAPSAVVVATRAVEDVVRILQDGPELDDLLEYLPDEVIDSAIVKSKERASGQSSKPLTFTDAIALDHDSTTWQLDSFAVRNFIFSRPVGMVPLSHLLVSPERSVHRYEVRSTQGECCKVTITMTLQETLTPQYRQSPRISHQWRLRSITGEAGLEDEQLKRPHVSLGPEAVVGAQLDALRRGDVASVFAFAPPRQEDTQPIFPFEELLRNPRFAPLVGHTRCDRLSRLQLSPNGYLEVVAIVSPATIPNGVQMNHVYLFEVARQSAECSDAPSCWVIQAVTPMSAGGPLLGV